ncbi:unnamed protein product, partial [Mesorhabditis belari]|uniref:Saposin B-type domain-containing protein n=1 Tax=Mesorhabditis belari TaxID=2138241 RepID=A0AAF3ESM6_9BILA
MRTLLLLAAFFTISLSIALPPNMQAGGGLFCTVCTELVKDAETSGEQDVKAYLTKEIKAFCDTTGFLSTTCQAAFNSVVDQLCTYINQKLPPDVCCQKVGLC